MTLATARPNTVQGRQLYILTKAQQTQKDVISSQIFSQQQDQFQAQIDNKIQKLSLVENRNIYSQQYERPVTEMQKSLAVKQFQKNFKSRISQIIEMDNGRNQKNISVTFEQARNKNQQYGLPESPNSSIKRNEDIQFKGKFEIKHEGDGTLVALSQDCLQDSNEQTKRTKIHHSFIRQNSKDKTFTVSNSKTNFDDNIEQTQRIGNKTQKPSAQQVHQKQKIVNLLPVVCPKVADLSRQFKQIQYQHKNMIQNTWHKKPSSKSQGRTKQSYLSKNTDVKLTESDYHTLDPKILNGNESLLIKYEAVKNKFGNNSDKQPQLIIRFSIDKNNNLQVIKESQIEHATKQYFKNFQKFKNINGIDLKLIQMPIDLSSSIVSQKSFMPQNNKKQTKMTPIIIPGCLSPQMKQISLIKAFGNRRVSFKEWLHPNIMIQEGSLSSQSRSRNFDSTMYNELYNSDQNSLSPKSTKTKVRIMATLIENNCGLLISSVRQHDQKVGEAQTSPIRNSRIINDSVTNPQSSLAVSKEIVQITEGDELFQNEAKKILTSSTHNQIVRKSCETANSIINSSLVQSNMFNLQENSMNIDTVINRSLLINSVNEKPKKSDQNESEQRNAKSPCKDSKLLMPAFSFRNGPNVLYVDNINDQGRNHDTTPVNSTENQHPPSSLSINNRQVAYQNLRAIQSRLQQKIVDISIKKVKKMIKSDRQACTGDSYSYRSPKCNGTETNSIDNEYLRETQIKKQVYNSKRSGKKSDRQNVHLINDEKIQQKNKLCNEQDLANLRITTKDIFNQQIETSFDDNKIRMVIDSKGQAIQVSPMAFTNKINTAKFTEQGSVDLTWRIQELRQSDDYKQASTHCNVKPQINTIQYGLLQQNKDQNQEISFQQKLLSQTQSNNQSVDFSSYLQINQAQINPKKNKFPQKSEQIQNQDYQTNEEFLKSQSSGVHHNKMNIMKRNPPVFAGGFIEGISKQITRPRTKAVKIRATSLAVSYQSSVKTSMQFGQKGFNGAENYGSTMSPNSIMSKKTRVMTNADVVSMGDIEQQQQGVYIPIDQNRQQTTTMSFKDSKQQYSISKQIEYNDNESPLVSRFTQGQVKSSQVKTREEQKIQIFSNVQNYKNSIKELEFSKQNTQLLEEPFTNSPQISKHIQDFQKYHKMNLQQMISEKNKDNEIQQELEKQIGLSATNETAKNQGTNVLSMDSIEIFGQNQGRAIQMNLYKRRCLSQMKKPQHYMVDDKPLDPFLVEIIHLKTLYIMQEELWYTYENEWNRFEDQNCYQVKAPIPPSCRTLVFHIYLCSLSETTNLPHKKNLLSLDLDSFDFNLYQQSYLNAKRRLQLCVFRVLDPNAFNNMKEQLLDGFQSIFMYEKVKQPSYKANIFQSLLFKANTLSQQDGVNEDDMINFSKNVTDLKNCTNCN